MALSSCNFWENYYTERGDIEWYVSRNIALEEMITILHDHEYINEMIDVNTLQTSDYNNVEQKHENESSIRLLHNGCGNSKLGMILSGMNENLIVHNVDFSSTCIDDMKIRYPNYIWECGDAKDMKDLYEDNYFDIILDKGLFDSVTSNHETATKASSDLIREAHRLLKLNGLYIIFSTFAYNDSEKPMKQFIDDIYNIFNIETKIINEAPLEYPYRNQSYIYILTKI